MNKAADKFRNLSPSELKQQEREQLDQLFRLKFQMKMGQTESLNKIRTLRRNVARLKTISRQHQLGIAQPIGNVAAGSSKSEASAAPAAITKAATVRTKTAVKAKSAARKTAAKKAGKK